MELLYDRKYRLVIGQPMNIVYTGDNIVTNVDTINATTRQNYVADYRIEQLQAVELNDLQIEVEVNGTASTSTQAACLLRITNLSDETRAIVEKNNNYVILEAGYAQDEELEMIFSGQVFNYYTEKVGVDAVTTLQCKEGYTPNDTVRVRRTYPSGTNYADILEDLASIYENNGVPLAKLVRGDERYNELRQTYVQIKFPVDIIATKGFSAIGYLRQILKNVCESLGYVNYITNGRLFIHPKGWTETLEKYQLTTDQIHSIRRSGNQGNTTSTGKGDLGVKIVTFLDGRLDVDKRIEIMDGEYQGMYKIISKSHSLNYRNGDWVTTIDCKSIST